MKVENSIIGIGDLVVDVITQISNFPITEGNFYLSHNCYPDAGGRSNFLIAASRLGSKVFALGCLGDDFWGQLLKKILTKEKIDLSLVQTFASTSRSIVITDQKGNHAFLGYFGEDVEYEFDRESVTKIQSASALYASGYNFQNEYSARMTLHAYEFAKSDCLFRGFDTGPIFHTLDPALQTEILSLSTHIFLTGEEFNLLNFRNFSRFFELGAKAVVIKLGKDGCDLYSDDSKLFHIPGLKVPVLDTTAAGDCFAAGFMTGLVKGYSLRKCAEFANCVGAAKVQKLGGGQNVPTLDQVRAVAKEFNITLP